MSTTILHELGIRHISRWIFNCYVIEGEGSEGPDGSHPVVVDPGIPSNANEALAAVIADGGTPRQIRTVCATHCHSDHVGGIPFLHRRTGAEIYLPSKAKDYLEGELGVGPSLVAMFAVRRILREQPFDARGLLEALTASTKEGFGMSGPVRFSQPVSGYLKDGEPLPDAPGFRVVAAPGHSACSICFYNESSRTLLSGDAVLTVGGRAWFTPELVDSVAGAATEERLRSLPVEHLLPGHGQPIHGKDLLGQAGPARQRASYGFGLPLCGEVNH